MLAQKIRGNTVDQIAKEFNCHRNTVYKTMNWAEKEGLVSKFEDQIIDELVPAAIDAYKKALKDGDTYVATEVLKGMNILKKNSERKIQDESTDEVMIWMKKRAENKQLNDKTADKAIIEGQSRGDQRQLTAPETFEAEIVPNNDQTRVETEAGDSEFPDYLEGMEEFQED